MVHRDLAGIRDAAALTKLPAEEQEACRTFWAEVEAVRKKAQAAIPRTVAHFRFNGNAKDKSKGNAQFELTNTEFKENALYLNGIYEQSFQKNAYRAVCKTPKLNYASFTVALKFKAIDFAPGKSNLITGGIARQFGMHRSQAGNLTVTLNNQEISYEIKSATLVKGKWTVVACGFDLPSRKVIVYLEGKKVAEIDLPKDFRLQAVKLGVTKEAPVWSFADYGDGNAFHGLVEELIIYERLLSADEFGKIPLVGGNR
jgi:hypothetical protein